jgi:hypothetical protein
MSLLLDEPDLYAQSAHVHFEIPLAYPTRRTLKMYISVSLFHDLDLRTKLHKSPNSIAISLFWQNLEMSSSPI